MLNHDHNIVVENGTILNCNISNNSHNGAAHWKKYSKRLASWASNRLIVRHDTFPEWDKSDNQWKRRYDALHEGKLIQHFKGFSTIGVYTLKPQENTCIYTGLDIDAHDNDPHADPVANWDYALKKFEQLQSLGIEPLLEDSNGHGGYHLWVLYDQEIPGEHAYAFGRWLTADCPEGIHVEVFPKQKEIQGFGNQLRLPGKHHKSDHWSRIYDAKSREFVSGRAAIQLLIHATPADPTLIPADALMYIPPPPKPKPINADGFTVDREDWWKEYDGNLRTLDIVALCKDRLKGTASDGMTDIVCPWVEEHTTGDGGTAIWPAQDDNFPGFNCLHSHCQHRKIEDLLAVYGKAAVDACCTEMWPQTEVEAWRLAEDEVHNLPPVGPPVEENIEDTQPDPQPKPKPKPEPEQQAPAFDWSQWDGVDPTLGDGDQPKQKRKRRGFTPGELATLPPVKYLIDGHFPAEGLICLVGASGSFKSFLALDYAFCICTGRPYLGVYTVNGGPQPVTYIAAEGKSGFYKRIQAWCQYNHVVLPTNMCIIPEAFNLLQEEEVDEILEISQETLGMLPKFIVVDTLARSFGGGSENDTGEMNSFVGGLDKLRKDATAAVCTVHHTGWTNTNRERGNSALRGAADTIIHVETTAIQNGKPTAVLINCSKQKDFDKFETYQLSRQIIDLGIDEDGNDVSSVVLVADKSIWDTRYRLLTKQRKSLLHELYQMFGEQPFNFNDGFGKITSMKSRNSFTQAVNNFVSLEMLTHADGSYRLTEGATRILLADGCMPPMGDYE